MLTFIKEATIKSIYDFGDIIILTIYYHLDNEYCEHQMQLTSDEIRKNYSYADHTLINKKMDIEIQIFTDKMDKEIVTITKI